MERLSDLLPHAARQLGLEDQLRRARAVAAWDALVAEHLPAAAGACRLVGFEDGLVVVEADQPIVAQELRLRSAQLLAALAAASGRPATRLRVGVRHV